MVSRYITCDKCGTNRTYCTNPSINTLRKWAREDGWSCGKKDLCPSCNPKNKLDNIEI